MDRVECIDFKYKCDTEYTCSKQVPYQLLQNLNYLVVKTDDNFVHFIDFKFGKHIRIDLLDIIPDEIMKVHKDKLKLLWIHFMLAVS